MQSTHPCMASPWVLCPTYIAILILEKRGGVAIGCAFKTHYHMYTYGKSDTMKFCSKTYLEKKKNRKVCKKLFIVGILEKGNKRNILVYLYSPVLSIFTMLMKPSDITTRGSKLYVLQGAEHSMQVAFPPFLQSHSR